MSGDMGQLPKEICENWEKFLDVNYHEMSRKIRADFFFGWLRSRGVVNQEDQEFITNKFYTEYMKAGALIDLIKTKGRSGFLMFMENLEYEYPELYSKICGVAARETSPEYREQPPIIRSIRKRHAQSVNIVNQMGDLINTMATEIANKSEKLTDLQKLVEEMKLEQIRQLEEHLNISQDLDELTTKMEETSRSNHELNGRLAQIKEEKGTLQKQVNELRALKDKYRDEVTKISQTVVMAGQSAILNRANSENAGNTTVLNKESGFVVGRVKLEALTRENENLKNIVTRLTSGKPKAKSELLPADEMGDTKENIEKLTMEKSRLEQKVSDLEYTCPQLRQTNDHLMNQISEIKEECDQHLRQLKQKEKLSKEMENENEALKTDCQKFQTQFRVMADMIEKLKFEIDTGSRWSNQRHKKTDTLSGKKSKNKGHIDTAVLDALKEKSTTQLYEKNQSLQQRITALEKSVRPSQTENKSQQKNENAKDSINRDAMYAAGGTWRRQHVIKRNASTGKEGLLERSDSSSNA